MMNESEIRSTIAMCLCDFIANAGNSFDQCDDDDDGDRLLLNGKGDLTVLYKSDSFACWRRSARCFPSTCHNAMFRPVAARAA
jgi:hypothetical protein